MNFDARNVVTKLETGIPGFDAISNGGIPKGRTTILCGTAGSSKTVFAVQYLACGITLKNESCVFVTFEESPEDIRQNMLGFGWDIAAWESSGHWAFVDASPKPDQQTIHSGGFDLDGLLARIQFAIKKVGASRLAIDSVGAIFSKLNDQNIIRAELPRISVALKSLGVTSLLTIECPKEYGVIARNGIEEFVADNVVILRNVLEAETRRRTMEILKFRGTDHQKGEHLFSIVAGGGIVGVPLSTVELDQRSSRIRVSSGAAQLDGMCGGGFFRDSIVLVSGGMGTGKTLLATTFIGGAAEHERSLFFAFEESRDQLFRNAQGWGLDFEKIEAEERLNVVCAYPEIIGLEEQLISMKRIIAEFKPTRIAVDGLSALEPGKTAKSFREFVIGLTSFIKQKEIVGVFTSVTPSLMGGASVTEAHISTIADSIFLLSYVELFGEVSRGVAVLKMRGSLHEKEIREFKIDQTGMNVGKPFRNITGILTGNPQYHQTAESVRLQEMF